MRLILPILLVSASVSLAFGQAFTIGDPCFVANLSPSPAPPGLTNPVVLFHFDTSNAVSVLAESAAGKDMDFTFGTGNALGQSGVISNSIYTGEDGFYSTNWTDIHFVDFSATFWLRLTNAETSGARTIISRGWSGSPAPGANWVFYLVGGTMRIDAGGTGGNSGQFCSPAYDEQWHHYGVTYNSINGECLVYIDGVLSIGDGFTGSGPFEADGDTHIFSLGTDCNGGNGPLNQSLDDLALFNSCLSSNRIAEIYSNGTNGIPIIP